MFLNAYDKKTSIKLVEKTTCGKTEYDKSTKDDINVVKSKNICINNNCSKK